DREPAKHRFRDHQGTRVVPGRKHEQVGCFVDAGQLRSVYEAEYSRSLAKSERVNGQLDFSALWPFAGHHQVRICQVGSGKGMDQVERAFPLLKLRAITDNVGVLRNVPR